MKDTIKAYDRFKYYFDKHSDIYIYPEYIEDLKLILNKAPKYGHWEMEGELYKCSCCGELSCCKGNFCCDCGTEMIEEN